MNEIIAIPPEFLSDETKVKFYCVANTLHEKGKWENGDELALSALFANYQHWVDAEIKIRDNKDMCFTTDSGYRQQIPEVSIANNAMKLMLTFIKEFGLTPKERAKLQEMLFNDGDDDMEGMVVK